MMWSSRSELVNLSGGLNQNILKLWLDVKNIEIRDTEGTTVHADTTLELDVFTTISDISTSHTELQDITVEVIRGFDIISDIGSITGDLER
jgi:hypothetical protein